MEAKDKMIKQLKLISKLKTIEIICCIFGFVLLIVSIILMFSLAKYLFEIIIITLLALVMLVIIFLISHKIEKLRNLIKQSLNK